MPVVFFTLSSPKIFIMRKSLPLLLSTILLTTGCSDIIEKQLEIYEDAIDELKETDEFPELMDEVMNTGKKIADIISKVSEEEKKELQEDYGENYKLMLDSVEKVREEYYSQADILFKGYIYNFVERRTLLYRIAADRYCKANSMEELNAISEILKRYSALSFVESQRACDPPAHIRKDYEAAKELAENCLDVAKKRIIDKQAEKDE